MHRRSKCVGGRGSRPGAGRTPQAGGAAQAASGSRPRYRPRGGTARCLRPAPGWFPSPRRAAPRTALAVLRSAGPGPGRARSPPRQGIEHVFETQSRMLLTPPVAANSLCGAALLTICSQTVRIHLDVAAHGRGKDTGQAHNGGRRLYLVGQTSGVQISALCPLLAPNANHRIDSIAQPRDRLTQPPHATIPSAGLYRAPRAA
jgi:hypothetical protein